MRSYIGLLPDSVGEDTQILYVVPCREQGTLNFNLFFTLTNK